ncbi:MAG: ArsR/SmtB family transcription factor [Woeseiaceae bacterium]
MNLVNLEASEQLLKAVGELSRLRLLHLCAIGEHTVSDLMAVMDQSQPRVSRHLKILCDAGLLERFRDGHWVYFRVPINAAGADHAAHLLSMTDPDDPILSRDRARMREVLGAAPIKDEQASLRLFNRLVLDQFLSRPVGDLLDIGVGNGAILRLLAGRATSAIGIDINPGLRREARRSFARRSLANCTIREGDMHRLSFDDASFDTVILDEVLLGSAHPELALQEAQRVMRAKGQLLLIEHIVADQQALSTEAIASFCVKASLRCGVVRHVYDGHSVYLVAVATADIAHNQKTA